MRRHIGTVSPGHSRRAQWMLLGAGALVVALGLLVWDARAHAAAGSLAIASLLAAFGIGAIAWGAHLLVRVRHARDGARADTARIDIADAAAEFLAKKRIAVTGVSRKPAEHGSNVVYRRLRERGYEVFAINPNATEVEGDRCFPDLKSIPGGVEAVVIATRPERAMATMRECAELGVEHVWMHRAMGTGSVSEEAAAWGRGRSMRVIAGGCPLMFGAVADRGHQVMRSLLTLTGKVPREV